MIVATADTITDAQITELRDEVRALIPHFKLTPEERETIAICDSALNPQCHAERRREARARCAAILNARDGIRS